MIDVLHPRWRVVTKNNIIIEDKKSLETASRNMPLKAKRFINSKNEPVKALHLDLTKDGHVLQGRSKNIKETTATTGVMKRKYSPKINFGSN